MGAIGPEAFTGGVPWFSGYRGRRLPALPSRVAGLRVVYRSDWRPLHGTVQGQSLPRPRHMNGRTAGAPERETTIVLRFEIILYPGLDTGTACNQIGWRQVPSGGRLRARRREKTPRFSRREKCALHSARARARRRNQARKTRAAAKRAGAGAGGPARDTRELGSCRFGTPGSGTIGTKTDREEGPCRKHKSEETGRNIPSSCRNNVVMPEAATGYTPCVCRP